ncbi:uncharacterized protein LOC123219978 isoform X2 [Mangifera indica]|uniref:uncharacterized protein LOC123219978 isoform X2 n=1 Tax=Mangifera indica TaxID=29780 RepID=UPI001CFC3387|nr:uncharacterized protein LOC123219978 isoform X2 [Mangifera indica]
MLDHTPRVPMATAKRRLARATAEEYSELTLLIFSGGSISKKIKKLFSAVQMIVAVFEVLVFALCCLIASITSYCFDKLRCAERAEPGAFWDYEFSYINFYSVPVLSKSWKFRANLFRGLRRSDVPIYIGPSPIIPRSEKHFFTPATAQDNANPIQSLPHETISTLHKQTGTIIPPTDSPQENANLIQYRTFCCNGDDVHNQQTDQPIEPVNSPVHNQTGNTSASFDIEAGMDIEARGTSSNETISSDVDNETGTSHPQTGNQNLPPNDNDGNDETPPNGVNRTSPNEDHNGKKEVEFVFMVGAQIIATGIAGLALKNTSNVSGSAIILRNILIVCMFVSLTCLLYALGLSVYKPCSSVVAQVVRVAASVVRVLGYVMIVITLLAATGLNLPNKLMLWVTSVVFLVCLPAIILYAIKIAREDTR